MAKSKTKVATKQAPQTISDLSTLIQGIENVTEKQALGLIPQLRETMHYSYYALGGLLVLVQDNAWWKNDPAQYETFKEYVEEAHSISRRKAFYFMKIYTKLTAAEVPLDNILAVGWTKLKEIVDVVNKDNVDHWVKLALANTVVALKELVRQAIVGSLETSGKDPVEAPSTLSKLTFTLHADQKDTVDQAIDKAKAEADSTYAGVALEGICMAYLSGAHTITEPVEKSAEEMLAPAEATLGDLMVQAGLMDTLELVEKIFEGTSITVKLPKGGVPAPKPLPAKAKKPAAKPKKKVAKKKVAKKKVSKADISKEL